MKIVIDLAISPFTYFTVTSWYLLRFTVPDYCSLQYQPRQGLPMLNPALARPKVSYPEVYSLLAYLICIPLWCQQLQMTSILIGVLKDIQDLNLSSD